MFTGSSERRHMENEDLASDHMMICAQRIIEKHGLDPKKDIDMIVTNVSYPDEPFTGAGAVLAAKSGSVVISGSIDSSNVLSKLNDIVDSIPDTVYGKSDLLLYVPTNVVKAYQQALAGGAQGANGFNNQLNVGEKPLNFNGIEMVHAPGLTSSKVVAAQKSNLHFGTGLLSDRNIVKVLDMADLDGSDNFRIIMRYTADTTFGIGEDIVYYGAY